MINLLPKVKLPVLKYFFLSLLQIIGFTAYSQTPINVLIKNTTLIASDNVLPFWFTSNRNGKVRDSGSYLNLSEISFRHNGNSMSKPALAYTWGGNYVQAFGENDFYIQLNNAFAGISWNNWAFIGGAFDDPVRYGGLSTTNGNLARSNNTRPYPRFRFSTLTYKPIPFLSNKFCFKVEYDEGLLNDKRYVRHARLHHKSLFLKAQPSPVWEVHAGFEHYVMWGGTSEDERIGNMPQSFKDYLQYVSGASGNENFPQMDQNNVAGNQLGTYQMEIKRSFETVNITLYLSHPFDDLSGVNWRNWPDNLLGIHFGFKQNSRAGNIRWITDLVYEFTDTRQQSVRDSLYVWNEGSNTWERQEPDNYFNHSIYRSGFTYHRQTIGSPLFFPVALNSEGRPGEVYALPSTRFFAHHFGAKGNLFSEYLQWKGLITYVQHLGTYLYPLSPAREQISGLIDLYYANPRFPVELGMAVASDSGNAISETWGLEFRVAKRFYY